MKGFYIVGGYLTGRDSESASLRLQKRGGSSL